jgi:hypothetical protein
MSICRDSEFRHRDIGSRQEQAEFVPDGPIRPPETVMTFIESIKLAHDQGSDQSDI